MAKWERETCYNFTIDDVAPDERANCNEIGDWIFESDAFASSIDESRVRNRIKQYHSDSGEIPFLSESEVKIPDVLQ